MEKPPPPGGLSESGADSLVAQRLTNSRENIVDEAFMGAALACLFPGAAHVGFVEAVTLDEPGLAGLDIRPDFIVRLEPGRVA
jgi:hypothetical protein